MITIKKEHTYPLRSQVKNLVKKIIFLHQHIC